MITSESPGTRIHKWCLECPCFCFDKSPMNTNTHRETHTPLEQLQLCHRNQKSSLTHHFVIRKRSPPSFQLFCFGLLFVAVGPPFWIPPSWLSSSWESVLFVPVFNTSPCPCHPSPAAICSAAIGSACQEEPTQSSRERKNLGGMGWGERAREWG